MSDDEQTGPADDAASRPDGSRPGWRARFASWLTARALAGTQRQVRRYRSRATGELRAVIERLGSSRAHVVFVDASGPYGDVVVPSEQAAEALCAAVDVPVAGTWDRDLTAAVQIDPRAPQRMAGLGR